ncbi:MAG: hypothetical protein RLZZ385_1129, partial [Pseudomonadota bacterium]
MTHNDDNSRDNRTDNPQDHGDDNKLIAQRREKLARIRARH